MMAALSPAILFLILGLPIAAAGAVSPPGSAAFCKAMIDHADRIWPLVQVRQCAPWRKRALDLLNKAALACQAAHKHDLAHPEACDAANSAATLFWEKSEYIENNRDIPPDRTNPVLHQGTATSPP